MAGLVIAETSADHKPGVFEHPSSLIAVTSVAAHEHFNSDKRRAFIAGEMTKE